MNVYILKDVNLRNEVNKMKTVFIKITLNQYLNLKPSDKMNLSFVNQNEANDYINYKK